MAILLGAKWVDGCLMVTVKTLLHGKFCCRCHKSSYYGFSALSPHANHLLLLFRKREVRPKGFG